jgi:hypothetical protein
MKLQNRFMFMFLMITLGLALSIGAMATSSSLARGILGIAGATLAIAAIGLALVTYFSHLRSTQTR